MYLYIVIGLTILGLIQWYFDRRSKRNLDAKYNNILSAIHKMNFPADKRLQYTQRVQDGPSVVETKYVANNVDELFELIDHDRVQTKHKSWSIRTYDDEIYGSGWGDMESEK